MTDTTDDAVTRIKTGDTVFHKPSGETWLVAAVDEMAGTLSWCGWPEGQAQIEDCELVKSCTAEQRVDLLFEMAGMEGNDHRKRYAKRELNKLASLEAQP